MTLVAIKQTLTGARELEAALRQLPRATAKGVLRRALRKAAAPTATVAEALAPRGATGNLLASIDVRTVLVKSQKKRRPKIGDVELFIGATTPKGAHAHLLEFGTSKMAAQPFLRPAWDSTKQQVLDAIETEIWESLSKAARTLAKKAAAGTLGKAAREALR